MRADWSDAEGLDPWRNDRPAGRDVVGGRSTWRRDDHAVAEISNSFFPVRAQLQLDHMKRWPGSDHGIVERRREKFPFAGDLGRLHAAAILVDDRGFQHHPPVDGELARQEQFEMPREFFWCEARQETQTAEIHAHERNW